VATRRVLANERQLASVDEEMRAARQIQASILPHAMPQIEGLDIAVRYAPMKAVAGDFYNFHAIQPGGLGILVADVAGHGVPAALVASMVKVAVSLQSSDGANPEKVIATLNAILCREAQGQYASAIYFFIDEASRIARYSAAGHPPPLLWSRTTGKSAPLNENGLLLGVRPEESYSQLEFSVEAGDRLLLYTDGLTEATNRAGLEFGEVRLKDFISAHMNLSAEQFADCLLREVLAWPGAGDPQAQSDDITFVVVDIGQTR
jgi:serine phosphatase RsbU (regulator of sigma subunit)